MQPEQRDLFARSGFDEAGELRDEAITRAINHADSTQPGWSTKAYAMLLRFLREVGGEFTGEDVRLWATERGIDPPPDPRAWGHVMKRAAVAGIIRKTGRFRTVKNPYAHLRPMATWQGTQKTIP